MRRVRIGEWSDLGEDTLLKLRLNLPPGGWFPALQVLSWCITEANLPYVDLFLSPHLKKISIRASWLWDNSRVPQDILPAIASTISTLPTSSLQSLMVGDHRTMPWAYFKDSFSSVVLRCGPSFTEYVCPVPLSDAAVNHLMQLPHLCIWRTHGPPPNYPLSSLPLVFPPLKKLTLAEGAAHGWLSLYRRLWDGTSTTQDVTPLDNVKKSLDSLEIDNLPGLIVDASFVSPIQMFCNMVHLNMAVFCHGANDAGRCTFKLNNDDVAKLTAALPQLKSLRLGTPCFENACATTVACLLPISVHCVQLESLEVHFNTTNIVADFMNISEDPRFQQLRSLPRCLLLTSLDVYRIPLTLDEACVETVAKGMIDIFPSLTYCEGVEQGWDEVSRRIVDLQEDELVSMTPSFLFVWYITEPQAQRE